MKKFSVIILLLCACFIPMYGQKYACFDSEYVLSNIPDYAQAQKRLDQYVLDWQKELETKQQEFENSRNAYQQEAYLLPENLKRRRQEDLKTKEQELKTLQYERFGVGGDLDKKRAELVKPIQDRVYNALSRLASEKGYAFIFDKSGNSSLAYVNQKYDVSAQVLEMLGVVADGKSNAAEGDKKKEVQTDGGKKPTMGGKRGGDEGKGGGRLKR